MKVEETICGNYESSSKSRNFLKNSMKYMNITWSSFLASDFEIAILCYNTWKRNFWLILICPYCEHNNYQSGENSERQNSFSPSIKWHIAHVFQFLNFPLSAVWIDWASTNLQYFFFCSKNTRPKSASLQNSEPIFVGRWKLNLKAFFLQFRVIKWRKCEKIWLILKCSTSKTIKTLPAARFLIDF